MTVEIEFRLPEPRQSGDWQLAMAEQIDSNRGFPIEDIGRTLNGSTLIVSVETTLPNQAVENMLFDIEDHLSADAEHVETREV